MNQHDRPLWLAKPQLSDEAAAQMLNFLQELLVGFENAFYDQLNRYYTTRRDPSSETPPSCEASDPDADPF
jgi:hypothetical protein